MLSPKIASPTEAGTVVSSTIAIEFDNTSRNSLKSPRAALREMRGSVAEAIDIPNKPSGSCWNRNA
jgi:hypothetical protein